MSDTENTGGFVPRSSEELFGSRPTERAPEPAGRPEPERAPARVAEQSGEAATPPPAAEASKPGPARDPSGRFAPQAPQQQDGEQQAAPSAPPAEQQQPQLVPVSAVQEERRKRQALEQRLREMESQYQQYAQRQMPQQPPPQPAVTEAQLADMMFADPQGYHRHQQQMFEQQLLDQRLALSEAMVAEKTDYPQAEAALVAYAQSHPQRAAEVRQMLRGSRVPALDAYRAGKELLAREAWGSVTQQYTSPDAYIEAERQKWLADSQQQLARPATSSAPPAPPASLASARSAGPRSGAAPWVGPRPPEAIWGRSR